MVKTLIDPYEHFLGNYSLINYAKQKIELPKSEDYMVDKVSFKLDGLNFYLKRGIPFFDIRKRLGLSNLVLQKTKDSRLCYIGHGIDDSIRIVLDKYGRVDDSFLIRGIYTNPSKYPRFLNYFEDLKQVMTVEEIANAFISRGDIAWDIMGNPFKLSFGLDIIHKKVVREYESQNSLIPDNFACGGNPHRISCYSKPDRMRIETQASKGRVPKRMYLFKEELLRHEYIESNFKNIKLYSFDYNSNYQIKSVKSAYNHLLFLNTLRTKGLYGAKRVLGKTWKSKIKDLVQINEMNYDYSNQCIQNLSGFMNGFNFDMPPDFEYGF